MRKIAAAGTLALAFALAGCRADSPEILVIGERFFAQQVDDILLNRAQYLGRTVRLEGIFRALHWHETDMYHYYVVRYVTSCCGPHPIGFELLPDSITPLPDMAWAEVTGVLEDDDGYIVIRVMSLVEMAERGAELVDMQ